MSPTLRGATIPRLLLQGRWQLPELAKYLGVSRAQLRRDMRAVRAAGWKIEDTVAHLGRAGGRLKTVWIEKENVR